MVRVALTIWLALPLLLPPGVCICDAFALARASGAEESAAIAEVADPASCTCCRHSPPLPPQSMADGPASPAKDHQPACPVRTAGVSDWKLADQSGFATIDLFQNGPIGQVAEAAAGTISPSSAVSADQPLYLILLSLRI